MHAMQRGQDHLTQMIGLFTSATRLGIDSHTVVALRMLRLARGGRVASDETQLMVFEKMSAFVEAQSVLAQDVMDCRSAEAASRTIELYHRKVRSNIARLS